MSERIAEYNDRIEALAENSYPQVELLKQIKGVGTLIGLTFLLTLEDPHRFRKSRDVGGYLGLQPGRRNSGHSQMEGWRQWRLGGEKSLDPDRPSHGRRYPKNP